MALTKIDDRGLKTPIDLQDNEKIRLGTGNDLEIYHSGSGSYISDVGTGSLYIQGENLVLENTSGTNYFAGVSGAEAILYHNGNAKFQTTSSGVSVTGGLTASGASEFTEDVKFDGSTAGRDILFDRSENKLHFADDAKAVFGESSDLQLFHQGGYSIIKDVNDNPINIQTDGEIKLAKDGNAETYARFIPDGAVELYYDNAKRLFTRSNGITVQGNGSGSGIDFQTDTTHRGTVWANSSNQIGFLDTGGDWAIKHTNDDSTKFYVQTNQKATIDADGLKFGTDTAAANALDDYEEGTFTPVLDNGVGSVSYNHQVGHYTKIGNQVFAYIYLLATAGSSDANALRVGGLPFANNNTTAHEGGGYITYMNGTFGTSGVEMHAMPWVASNQDYVVFHTPEDGNNVYGNQTNFANKYLIFQVRYHV